MGSVPDHGGGGWNQVFTVLSNSKRSMILLVFYFILRKENRNIRTAEKITTEAAGDTRLLLTSFRMEM